MTLPASDDMLRSRFKRRGVGQLSNFRKPTFAGAFEK